MSEDRFDQINKLIDALVAQCELVDVEQAGLAECVDLIGKLKALGLSADGLTTAAMGRVGAIQAAEREAATKDRGGGDAGNGAGNNSGFKPEPLPGPDRTLHDVVIRAGKQPRKDANQEIRIAEFASELFPRFLGAMRRGKISKDYVAVLKAVTRGPELQEKAQDDEEELLALALEQGVDEFKKSLRSWQFKRAPLVAERVVTKEARQENFAVMPGDGGYKIYGWLSAMNGVALNTALRECVGVPAKDDRRKCGERNAEGLMKLVYGGSGSGSGSGSGTGAGAGVGVGAGAGTSDELGSGAGVGTDPHVGSGPWPGGAPGNAVGSGNTRPSGLRHQVLVHVPLATLIRTEEAIEAGCKALAAESAGSAELAEGGGDPESGAATPSGRAISVGSATTGPVAPGHVGIAGVVATEGATATTTASELGKESQGGLSSVPGSAFGRQTDLFDVGEPPDWASADPPDRTAAHQPIAGELDCPTEGLGLGRRGACLERRDDLERDLGAVLGMIRAGIDVGMLDGFAPAKLSDGSPLAPSQLGQLLCDSDLTRVVLTAHGEPIDVSRSQRLFSARQSKAVLARDQHCRFPGCWSGLEVGQVHHAQEWEKGGATVVDNAVLLCFHHHRYVHSKQITIAHHAGGFVFTERNGARIGITRHVEVLAA